MRSASNLVIIRTMRSVLGTPLVMALLGLLALAVQLPNLPINRAPHEDAGVFLYAGDLLRHGALPYRDVWDHKPPLVYLLNALGLTLAGGSALGVWALQTAGFVAASVIGFTLLSRAFGLAPAFVGSVAWLLTVPRLALVDGVFTNFVQLYAPLLQWGALALFLGETRRTTFGSGLLGGCAALLSPTLGGLWIARAIVLLARRAWSHLGALGLGAALAFALAFVPFAVGGALGDAIDQALRYNSVYTSETDLAARFEAIRWGLRLTLSSGLAPLALLGFVVGVVRLWRGPRTPLLAIATIAFPLDLVLASASGRAYDHYYIAWIPSMTILAAAAMAEVLARARRFGMRHAISVQSIAVATVLVTIALMSVRPVAVVRRAFATEEDGASRIAANYLAREVRPNETAFIWGSRTEALFLAERRSPTRYVYPYGPLFTVGYSTDARVQELIDDLRRNRPAVILDASGASPVTPPLDRAGMLAYDTNDRLFRVPPSLVQLVDLIDREYVRAGELDHSHWPIYLRRDRLR